MRLLLFNLVTDADDPVLGFATGWIRALARRVERVSVVTMKAGRIDVPGNVEVYSVGKERGWSEARRAWNFYRIVPALRADACFSHMNQIFSILAAPVLRPRRVPIVTWYLHPHVPLSLRIAHALSDRMVSATRETYPYRRDKLVSVGHGIDTDLFSPDGATGSGVLCVGRLSPVKDHPTLLRAAAKIGMRVAVVGASLDKEYARSLRGLHDRVDWAGPVPQAELPGWYRKCAVHVNCAGRGFGDKVALEAMACGRPCLMASDAFRETLGRYADRLLFRAGDADDLATKLKSLLGAPDLAEMGAYLREQVVRLHGLDRLAGRIVELLESLRRR